MVCAPPSHHHPPPDSLRGEGASIVAEVHGYDLWSFSSLGSNHIKALIAPPKLKGSNNEAP